MPTNFLANELPRKHCPLWDISAPSNSVIWGWLPIPLSWCLYWLPMAAMTMITSAVAFYDTNMLPCSAAGQNPAGVSGLRCLWEPVLPGGSAAKFTSFPSPVLRFYLALPHISCHLQSQQWPGESVSNDTGCFASSSILQELQ